MPTMKGWTVVTFNCWVSCAGRFSTLLNDIYVPELALAMRETSEGFISRSYDTVKLLYTLDVSMLVESVTLCQSSAHLVQIGQCLCPWYYQESKLLSHKKMCSW